MWFRRLCATSGAEEALRRQTISKALSAGGCAGGGRAAKGAHLEDSGGVSLGAGCPSISADLQELQEEAAGFEKLSTDIRDRKLGDVRAFLAARERMLERLMGLTAEIEDADALPARVTVTNMAGESVLDTRIEVGGGGFFV